MHKRKFALGATIILIVVMLYLSYQNLQSIIVSRILPTQTSIFGGHVDINLIDNLRKPQWNGRIGREQAIGLAELYCAEANSLPEENPSNLEASLISEKDARSRLQDEDPGFSTRPVWLVSMDGLWEHEPPPAGPDETSAPIQFRHCDVIIDAKTGEMSILQNTGQ
jgi:hypothetical protein